MHGTIGKIIYFNCFKLIRSFFNQSCLSFILNNFETGIKRFPRDIGKQNVEFGAVDRIGRSSCES